MDTRRLFFQHVAQTSESPLAIHIKKAAGSKLWDNDGNEYIDLIAGISVCNIGHRHKDVVNAIKEQTDQYLHVFVYGEMIESPQVQYAQLLAEHLPSSLNSVYFTNSGAEAVEGAMKLAKRATGRTDIISFTKSYHGSTQGALSLMGDDVTGRDCSIWFNAVVRGDVNSIRIGNKVNIQDGAVIHCTYKRSKTVIGNNVSIGHNAIVHGCTVHDDVLIGMGAIVMDNAEIGSNSIIAAGAVVLENTKVEPGSIYAGVPAVKVKNISPDLINGEINRIADNYLKYAGWFR